MEGTTSALTTDAGPFDSSVRNVVKAEGREVIYDYAVDLDKVHVFDAETEEAIR